MEFSSSPKWVSSSRRNEVLLSVFVVAASVAPSVVVCNASLAWPFLASVVLFGCIRVWYGDTQVRRDCGLFTFVSVLVLWRQLWGLMWEAFKELGQQSEVLHWPSGYLTPFITGLMALLGLFIFTGYRTRPVPVHSQALPEGTTKWNLEHPRAWIFPCRTTHTRLFPKRHSFGYSYLLCGFPIIPAGTLIDGTDMRFGDDRVLGNWWLRIKADDYLERGYGEMGFYGTLKYYLRQNNVEDSEWSYAYLLTAPRFFGYSFNPASFWYIYNKDHELKKMIIEVNNTFGEKRMYLLDGSSPPSPPRTSGSEGSETEGPEPPKSKFTDIWLKDFHVSPFNSRKGSYALKALDPFPRPDCLTPTIDNTITMKSSKDHAKIVARVYTTAAALDSKSLGLIGTLRFIGGWWWVGLMTFPRILKEAFKLFFRRGLHVWFRPEVLPSSIGRVPTSIESTLQPIFREYLNTLVHRSTDAYSIDYKTAMPSPPKQVVTTSHRPGHERVLHKLNLHVLSPAFYSRFVHYSHTSEAFDRECLFTNDKNRTLWISHPEQLPGLLTRSELSRAEEDTSVLQRSHIAELRWTLLRRLRCAPAEPAYPVTPKSSDFHIDDIRTLPFSDMDDCVREPRNRMSAGAYRRAVTKIFLAQLFAFGFIEVIDLLDFGLRFLMCYIGTSMLVHWCQEAEAYGFGRRVVVPPGTCVGEIRGAHTDRVWLSGLALCMSGIHIYGLSKGYH